MTNDNDKSLSILRGIQIAMVAGMFIAGIILYPYLPDIIPTHWGFEGEANGWGPKTWSVWLLPGMGLIMMILFPVLQKLDPKSQNYEDFRKSWTIIQTTILGMLFYIFAVTMFVTMRPEYGHLVGRLFFFGTGLMFVILGNYMGKVRQNYFVGLKTPWTLNDPEIWQKSQRVAGWAFVLCGLVGLVESLLWIAAPYVFFGSVALMVIVPIAYSYKLAVDKRKTV